MYRKTLIACAAIIAIPSLSAAALGNDDDLSPSTAPSIDADSVIVVAADPTAANTPSVTAILPGLAVPLDSVSIADNDGALSDDDLLQLRGGHAIVVGNQTLTAVTNGTFNGNYSAGSVTLADNALSNFNGLGNLVINTGAQNNLQSAMNVTINFAQ
jgi:hypothetical protein